MEQQYNILIKDVKKMEDLEDFNLKMDFNMNKITIEKIDLFTNANAKTNRFYNIYELKKIISTEICEEIIRESEKYAIDNGWTTSRHINYPTTDIPLNKIVSINLKIREIIYKIIIPKIKTLYNIINAFIYGVDIFIVKYEHDKQNYLDYHTDAGFISFNVLLNNEEDFEGGGTMFEDGTYSQLCQGDILIHCGKIKHCGVKITKGKRYIMVGHMNIKDMK